MIQYEEWHELDAGKLPKLLADKLQTFGFQCLSSSEELTRASNCPRPRNGLAAEKQEEKMVKEIMKDLLFLGQKAEAAVKEDIAIAEDLLDTLRAHREHCVGMAANMIGERKSIIAIAEGNRFTAMLNPEVVKKSQRTYKVAEGCLSIPGEREVDRHDWIEVKYRNMDWHKEKRKFTGFEAEIVQHELDHLEGKLI